ncbi:MAG: hypothetical protein DWQ36_17565 [Acidobacteria bacterium]|nr:MAG: hypothetical protein DWQ30_15985 [Acidobacteriota bacterium]REK04249.1 MAG: hypothetical protein DWQ36_17565 [Acidobacteriota bacterium]
MTLPPDPAGHDDELRAPNERAGLARTATRALLAEALATLGRVDTSEARRDTSVSAFRGLAREADELEMPRLHGRQSPVAYGG